MITITIDGFASGPLRQKLVEAVETSRRDFPGVHIELLWPRGFPGRGGFKPIACVDVSATEFLEQGMVTIIYQKLAGRVFGERGFRGSFVGHSMGLTLHQNSRKRATRSEIAGTTAPLGSEKPRRQSPGPRRPVPPTDFWSQRVGKWSE